MRISDANFPAVTRSAAGGARAYVRQEKAAATSADPANVSVAFSARAEALAGNAARIAELKARVQTGSYAVDASKIAEKLVES